jgi:hypothetical protein
MAVRLIAWFIIFTAWFIVWLTGGFTVHDNYGYVRDHINWPAVVLVPFLSIGIFYLMGLLTWRKN